MVNNPSKDMWIGEVEDRINTALNAARLSHDYVENFLNSVLRQPGHYEEASTACYAIGHWRTTVEEAYQVFHAYMQQELAKQRAASAEVVA